MQQMFLTSDFNKPGFSLREAVAVLFRRKWLIVSVFLVSISTVAIITLLLPNRYESRMKILVKNSRADVIVSPEQTSNMALTGEVSEAQVNSEIELIQSRDLLEAVVKKTGLAGQFVGKDRKESPVAVEKALRQLEKDLAITPVRKANIIDIGYSAPSPQQVALVLRSLADLYLERHLQVHRIPGTGEFFKSQATEYERQLKDAELSLADFEAKNNIVSLPLQKEMGLKRIVDAETDLQATDTGTRETAKRIEQIKQQLKTLDARITTQRKLLPHQYSIERMNTMLVELQHKRTQLLSRFQPKDRLVKEVDQQIADTTAALDKVSREQSVEQTSDVNPVRQSLELELARAQTELTAKQSRRGSISKQVQGHRAKLIDLESTTLTHGELERRVKELKENYHLFVKKRDESLVTDALDKQKISNVSIAETPSVPSLPSGPNRKLNLILGLFLAGFLGLGSGIGAEFLRETVHTPRELEGVSKYPVLATVPSSRKLDGGREYPILAAMSYAVNEGEDAGQESEEGEMKALNMSLADVESGPEPVAESFIQFETEPIPVPEVVEVASETADSPPAPKRPTKSVAKKTVKTDAGKATGKTLKTVKGAVTKVPQPALKKGSEAAPVARKTAKKSAAKSAAKAPAEKAAKKGVTPKDKKALEITYS